MNARLRSLIRTIFEIEAVGWLLENILGRVTRIHAKLIRLRNSTKGKAPAQRVWSKYFPDMKVQRGPFKGLLYPSSSAFGSTLFPKLFGSYESELSEWVEFFCENHYDLVVDVGCAEGYYAIGFALRMPKTNIITFDISPVAQELCRKMAEANGVATRLTIRGNCTPEELVKVTQDKRALIIIDCEGYEMKLLSETDRAALVRHDFMIEVHDYLQPEATRRLSTLFEETHDVFVIQSLDDLAKAYNCRIPELEGSPLEERLTILSENRLTIINHWLILKARGN